MSIILHGAYAFTSLIVLILPVIQSPCPLEQYLYQLGGVLLFSSSLLTPPWCLYPLTFAPSFFLLFLLSDWAQWFAHECSLPLPREAVEFNSRHARRSTPVRLQVPSCHPSQLPSPGTRPVTARSRSFADLRKGSRLPSASSTLTSTSFPQVRRSKIGIKTEVNRDRNSCGPGGMPR